VSLSYRPLLVPGVALASAGVVALAPAVLAPPAPSAVRGGAAVPAVHVEDVQLAGIGQDIYEAITPSVQYVVGGVSYLINFIPLIGGPIAAQININYFQGVQPVVEATVNYLAAVVQDPLDIIAATGAYGQQLYDIGYNWVDAELRFLGLPRLLPLPESDPVTGSASRVGAIRAGTAPAPAAAVDTDIGAVRVPVAEAAPAAPVAPAAPAAEDIAPVEAPAAATPPAVTSSSESARAARGPVGSPRAQTRAAGAAGLAAAADRPDRAGQRTSARAARAAA